MAESTIDHSELLALTSDIVAAHASNNAVPSSELSGLIEAVFGTLSDLSSEPAEPVIVLKPAVPIKKSVHPDYVICLEDGMKLKMLKRHLRASYDMSPDEYRQRWGLPADYPMVAPKYAAVRSALAKKIGLGRKAGSKVRAGKVRK